MQVVANDMVLVRVGKREGQRWAHARRCKVSGQKSKREERAGGAGREKEVLPALSRTPCPSLAGTVMHVPKVGRSVAAPWRGLATHGEGEIPGCGVRLGRAA